VAAVRQPDAGVEKDLAEYADGNLEGEVCYIRKIGGEVIIETLNKARPEGFPNPWINLTWLHLFTPAS
jgi:hypothetical protein